MALIGAISMRGQQMSISGTVLDQAGDAVARAKLTATPSLIFWPLAAIAIVTMAVCSTLGDLVPKKEVTLASIVNELRSFKPSWALIAAVGVSVMLLAGAAYFSSK